MKHTTLRYLSILGLTIAVTIGGVSFVGAETISDEINSLNSDIDAKQSNINNLNSKIEMYQEKISQKQAESANILNQIELLENRMTKTELSIQVTNEEIDLANAEIKLLDQELRNIGAKLEDDKETLKEVLQQIQLEDNRLSLEVYFGENTFADIFDHLEYLENMNKDLQDSLEDTKASKNSVLATRSNQELKREQLEELQDSLADSMLDLEGEVNAKDSLLLATSRSEAQFQSLLKEVQEEQAYINYQISILQSQIEERLNASDELGDSSVMSWPAYPSRGLSATFHDPTYPFRHLFEHSGIDLPLGQGTPLSSAAPGYVAYARQGRSYGNYVMIIHSNGFATLYAHMSQVHVTADQFVARGETIGLSGGMPGTAGAGLSTGPHLHFEIRLNGIPVNPLNYLVGY